MAAPGSAGVRAAILAGGRGRRLGGAKPRTELGGRPLISYPLAAATEAGLDPFVVAKRSSALPELACEIVREPDLPSHPLVGALAGVRAAPGGVLLLGCDMPFVTAELLRWLASVEPPAVVSAGGRLQPLLGVYDESAEPAFADALTREAPLREAVERLTPRRLESPDLDPYGDPARLTFSVDSREDVAVAERMLGG